MIKKSMIATFMGIALILTACGSPTPTGTTAPSGTTIPSGTTVSKETSASSTTQGTVTNTQTTSSSQTSQAGRDGLTFANYDEVITFNLDQALALWATTFPSAKITAIELDFSDINWFYGIEGIDSADRTKEYALHINAVTGKIRNKEEANDDNDDKIIDLTKIISLKEALDVAKAESSPDTIIKEWKLDWDWYGGDFIWYEFDLADPAVDLKVNAMDKTIGKQENSKK